MDNANPAAPHSAVTKPETAKAAGLNVMIIGAGLAGSLLACFLAKRGANVSLYERRPDPRVHGFLGGRSINLALSERGIHALRQVGLGHKVLADAVPMRGRMLHSPAGELRFQRYSAKSEDAINSVSRGGLNVHLLNAAAEYSNVSFTFDRRCIDLDPEKVAATFITDSTGETTTASAQLIIGADGAFSAVRDRLMRTDRFDYEQDFLEHGYKELTIPPTAEGNFAMEPNALHIWPRGGYMMIALPNADKSFTCTCFWPFTGPNGFEQLQSDDEILHYFKEHFPDAVPMMPTLMEDYKRNPTSSLVTIRCDPWHHRGNVLLLGDAAHAIVPFYGQGMNAAFEDCTVFDQCIERFAPNWPAVLDEFSRRRKPSADAIANLAFENFIEMRDKVKSRRFLLKKKVEHALHRIIPWWYMPLYNMISFSRLPYEQARRRARRQDAIIFRMIPAALLLLIVAAAAIVLYLTQR